MNLTHLPGNNMSESGTQTLGRLHRALKSWLMISLACCVLGAHAQNRTDEPEWKETEVPAPPKFDPKRRIAIDMPRYVSMEFGFDPATLSITSDGVVRYVMLAVNPSGTVTAFYEGIRCATGEVKSYARANAEGVWTLVKEPQWRRLNDGQPSKHALALAMQGACEDNAPARSEADVVRKIKVK